MNYQEILAKLEEQYGEYDSYSDDYSIGRLFNELYGTIEGVGEFKQVAFYEPEGDGNQWSVKHFIDHDVYIRLNGYYSSYEGIKFYNGWGDAKEVKPVTKTVTVYE